MNNTQKFVELAISGGWKLDGPEELTQQENVESTVRVKMFMCEVLIDPTAWQAVGKVKKGDNCFACGIAHKHQEHEDLWISMWHRFIDLLASGMTIEPALGEILK